jgi:VanZ family protein
MAGILYRHAALFAVVWVLIILLLCATPGQYIPSADWMDLLSVDKLVHALMFFILNCLLFLTALKHHHSSKMLAFYFFAAVIYGISLEVMQASMFSNRSSDWKDVIANTFGCLVALLFLKRISKYTQSQNHG